MKQLYNKSALDRISSQSQLDKMVNIVPSSTWIAIIGSALILAGLIVWGFFGEIPSSLICNGIYINEEGTVGQYADTDGRLIDIKVIPGQSVTEGDIIALIADDEYYKLEQLDDRIAYVENITFESDFDTVTADTEELSEIKRKANMVDAEVQATQTSLDIKREKLNRLADDVENKKAELLRYKETYYSTLAVDDPTTELKYNESEQDFENSRAAYENAKSAYLSQEERYYEAKKQFDAKYRHFSYDDATEDEQREYDTEKANLQAMADEAKDYSLLLEYAQDDYSDANDGLDIARADYITKLNESSGRTAENSIAYNEYTELLNAYNTLLGEYRALSNEVGDLEIKQIVNQFNKLQDYDGYAKQFENQKAAVLSKLHNDRNECLNEVTKDKIISSRTGRIYMVDAELGSLVKKGQKVATVFPSEAEADTVVRAFVPYSKIAQLRIGDTAHFTPTGLNQNEYGYMLGEVTRMNTYLETTESMMETINNDTLVRQLTDQGAVISVFCTLKDDPDSINGKKWSSEKGKRYDLSKGDMMDIVFITEHKRPIDVFIPYIKDKLDFKDRKDKKENDKK